MLCSQNAFTTENTGSTEILKEFFSVFHLHSPAPTRRGGVRQVQVSVRSVVKLPKVICE